jgi:Predicted membrane protein
MKKIDTFTLTQLGIFSALIILLTITPLGYISTGIIAITTIHVPVIIGAIVIGPKGGAILGLVMGITNFIKAWLAPPSPVEQIIFTNPIVSILPRILIGLFAGLVFWFLSKNIKKPAFKPFSCAVATIAGGLTNTILVLTLINLIYKDLINPTGDIFSTVFLTIISVNGLIEIIGACIITVPISMILLRLKSRLRS